MTSEISKSAASRLNSKTNISTIDQIKYLLTDCDNPSQQLLAIKAVLKDPIFSKESDQSDVINIDNESTKIVDSLKKTKQRKSDLEGCGVNTIQRG